VDGFPVWSLFVFGASAFYLIRSKTQLH
jgi:hypothetical protein